MSEEPFFSVCVPVYNGAAFLSETVESVLAQTFKDFEVVILDNASTDASFSIASRLAARDVRVKVFRNEAVLPMGGNWEKCLSLARGACVGLLSADDMYMPGFLEAGRRALVEDGRVIFTANHVLQFPTHRRPRRMWAREGERRDDLAEILLRNPFSINFTLFKREVLEDTRRRDGRVFTDDLTCDYDLWIRLSERFPIYYTKSVLGVYRVHGNNLSANKRRMYNEVLAVLRRHGDRIRRTIPLVGFLTVLRIRARMAVVSLLEAGGCLGRWCR